MRKTMKIMGTKYVCMSPLSEKSTTYVRTTDFFFV